jgi:hypothetical protein
VTSSQSIPIIFIEPHPTQTRIMESDLKTLTNFESLFDLVAVLAPDVGQDFRPLEIHHAIAELLVGGNPRFAELPCPDVALVFGHSRLDFATSLAYVSIGWGRVAIALKFVDHLPFVLPTFVLRTKDFPQFGA